MIFVKTATLCLKLNRIASGLMKLSTKFLLFTPLQTNSTAILKYPNLYARIRMRTSYSLYSASVLESFSFYKNAHSPIKLALHA
jgi:hypothetical protein